MEVFEEYLQFS